MLLPSASIQKIAIFRALQLGDLLCAVPAFKALREAYPSARISLIGLPGMKDVAARFPDYLDEFISFPGYPGLPEQRVDARSTASFLLDMAGRSFDLALQMQGNGSIVNSMVELFGAKYVAGFCTQGHYCADNHLFIRYPEGIPEIHKHLLLMNHLGIRCISDDLEFPLTETDARDFDNLDLAVSPKQYICLHPGSRGSWRQWPPENFALLADRCYQMGWQIVFTGAAGELPIIEKVVESMQSPYLMAAGRTGIGALGVLINNAGGIVCNCTGVSHIASALKIKSVVISMDGEPERWAPLDTFIHRTIDWTRTPVINLAVRAAEQLFSSGPALKG